MANTGNQVTLHTSAGCDMSGIKRIETGTPVTTACNSKGNTGCIVQAPPPTSGEQFNQNGGGVSCRNFFFFFFFCLSLNVCLIFDMQIYATELRDDGIRTWFFPRSSIPQDITSENPDPSSWGTAMADFPNTKCPISKHFKNQRIVVNISMCGDLASQPQFYQGASHCPGNCKQFVQTNAEAFTEAYWEFSSFKIFNSS